jgi:mannose-6-phosphate isomerase-like protein (cupin superfamily)
VARVTIDEREFDITLGGHCDIAPTQVHRLRNCTDGPLEIIEVQIGEYLGEDDIARLEDGYGRT